MASSDATTQQQPSVELILLRWMLASSTVESLFSNVDLANCSNLNRKWRRETKQAILEQASASASALMKVPLLLLPSMVHAILCDHQKEDDDGQQTKNSNSVSRHHHPRAFPAETFCAAWFASEGVQQIEISLKDGAATSTATTNAMMQHDGYHHQPHCSNNSTAVNDHSNPRLLSVDNNHNVPSSPNKSALTNSSCSKNSMVGQQQQQHSTPMSSFSFMTPNGKFVLPGINHGGDDNGHYDANDNNNNNNNDHSPKSNTTTMMSHHPHGTTMIPVCYEWQGYSTAPQVLRPFSYCPSFVNDVLQAAVALLLVNKNHHKNNHNASMLLDNNNNDENDSDDDERAWSLHRMVAVRGATTARPESYCQCVDAKQAQAHWDLSSNHNNGSDPPPQPHPGSPMSLPEPPEKRQRLEQYLKRIEHVQRDVCPRIVTRRNGGTAVQFLNAATSHAVCMMTPLFDQPLQQTAITIFCVGIATEDGCFLSGLFRRLELGHLYPHSVLHAATELSAICVASGGDGGVDVVVAVDTPDENDIDNDHDDDETERQHQPKAQPEQPEQQQQHQQQRQQQKQSVKDLQSNDHDHGHDDEDDDTNSSMDDNGDDDDDDEQLISARQCKCQFRGVCEKSVTLSTNGEEDDEQDDDDDEDEDDSNDNDSVEPPFVSRGQTGPGAWHCYTAVIDPFAGTTLIRVDGIQESSSSSGSKNTTNPQVVLDGLTLGSDHNFGMSLCCGGMSDGSGHGAMAEVAVFAGRLPASDIICIEQHLMRKHDIVIIPPTTSATMMLPQSLPSSSLEEQQQQHHHQRDNDSSKWHREAHALLVVDDTACSVTNQPDNGTAGGRAGHNVPLRYLARHRNVAWKQTDPVTGQAKRIQRIGCRYDAESSDFE
jgi:hypothetical protein